MEELDKWEFLRELVDCYIKLQIEMSSNESDEGIITDCRNKVNNAVEKIQKDFNGLLGITTGIMGNEVGIRMLVQLTTVRRNSDGSFSE